MEKEKAKRRGKSTNMQSSKYLLSSTMCPNLASADIEV
jgi:hypothetical protein